MYIKLKNRGKSSLRKHNLTRRIKHRIHALKNGGNHMDILDEQYSRKSNSDDKHELRNRMWLYIKRKLKRDAVLFSNDAK